MNVILLSALVIGLIGIGIALVLNFAGDRFYVPGNAKAEAIRELLPGNNCGGCGFAGCDALSEAIAEGRALVNACPMCVNHDKIGEICGVSAEKKERLTAFVACNGNRENAEQRGVYFGAMDCIAAKSVQQNGGKSCQYGCMGFGSCVTACQFHAISVENGVAVVNSDRCTGCGQCMKVCPNGLISLKPLSAVVIRCSSRDKGVAVKQACKTGCLGCGLCAKNCPEQAIEMAGALPVVNHEKCIMCGTCAEKCPTKAIMIK